MLTKKSSNICWGVEVIPSFKRLNWHKCHFAFFSQSLIEPQHDKNKQNDLCPQQRLRINLDIHPVWSESSLSAWRNLGSLATHWAHSEDSDQTGRMPRLIWVFAGHTVILLVLSCCSLITLFSLRKKKYILGVVGTVVDTGAGVVWLATAMAASLGWTATNNGHYIWVKSPENLFLEISDQVTLKSACLLESWSFDCSNYRYHAI